MKSIVMKSIYAGLGLIATGKETVEQIGHKLAKQVNMSEKDGEKIARHLKDRSEKAIHAIQKTLDAEVTKVVHALHVATRDDVTAAKKRKAPARARKHRRAKRKPALATAH